jgi:hypothetical protein
MPMEFLCGHLLSDADLAALRRGLENCDRIEVVNDEMRALVERNWPHLVPKLPPEED